MTVGESTKCLVRLYKDHTTTSAYIDLTDIQGPVIKTVENYGTTGTLTIINDLSFSSRNLLSESCSRWSSGKGALEPGMFLRIWHTSRTDANAIGVFLITEISPSDDTIAVTFGDRIQLLRATGADYYRTLYASAQQHNDEDAYGGWDSTAEKLYLIKPAGVTLSAENGDVKWAVNDSQTFDDVVSDQAMAFKVDSSSATFTFTLDADWLYSLTLTKGSGVMLKCRVRTYVGSIVVDTTTYSETSASSSDVKRTITLSSPAYIRGKSVKIVIDSITSTYGADFNLVNFTGATFRYINRGISEYESGSLTGYMLETTFQVSSYVYASAGEADSSDDTRYYITGLEGISSIDSSYGTPAFEGRGKITYLVTAGGQSMWSAFAEILEAAEMDIDSWTALADEVEIGVMRCGGADFFDYFLALADLQAVQGSASSRQFAFRPSRLNWNLMDLGMRYKADDTSVMTIYYAEDGEMDGQPLMAFVPTKTMQYRPNLAVTRGTKDDGTPIIIAVRDPEVSIGSASSLVNGSTTEITDAALSSYSEIATNRSKDWEGQVKLSGIHLNLMTDERGISDSDFCIGGAPVRIYDSRYGMSGYAARVKEVTWDFTNQTTLVTLNNYSEMYANSLIDSSKMAYSAGGMAVEATSSDLFTLQYVRLESTATLSSASTHTIDIYSAETGWVSATADVVRMLDLGIAVLSAYYKRGIASIKTQYGITKVRVDGSTEISIPYAHRPDKYSNQALIVNVQMQL